MQPLAPPPGHVWIVSLRHRHALLLRLICATACKPWLKMAHASGTSGSDHCLAVNIAPAAVKLLQRTDALPSTCQSSMLLLAPTCWAAQRLTASSLPLQVWGQPAQRVAQLHGLCHPHAQAQPAPRLGAAAGERQPRSGPSYPAACDKPHAQRQRLQHSLTGAQQVQSQTRCPRNPLVCRGGHDSSPGGALTSSQLRQLSCHAVAKWLELTS